MHSKFQFAFAWQNNFRFFKHYARMLQRPCRRFFRPRNLLGLLFVTRVALVFTLLSCLTISVDAEEPKQSLAQVEKVQTSHLSNVVRVCEGVYSGALPEADSAFDELKSIGIKTIISVDGKSPDEEQASKRSMRYVHLPHGYDSVPPTRVLEIAAAIRDLPKPIYIHCHHGLHRSPSAAAAACKTLGLIDASTAREVLRAAGTGANYRGLYQSVETANYEKDRDWSVVNLDFTALTEVSPLARSMVQIDDFFSKLSDSIEQNEVDKKVVDSEQTPQYYLLMLKESYDELARSSLSETNDTEFKKLLEKGVELCDTEIINPQLVANLKQNCKACHQQFRDN